MSDFDVEYDETETLCFHEALLSEWADVKNGKMKRLTF